jgi:hypothetical protein
MNRLREHGGGLASNLSLPVMRSCFMGARGYAATPASLYAVVGLDARYTWPTLRRGHVGGMHSSQWADFTKRTLHQHASSFSGGDARGSSNLACPSIERVALFRNAGYPTDQHRGFSPCTTP